MILFINVSQQEARLALIEKKIIEVKFISQRISEDLLSNIEKLLKKNKSQLEDLKKIAVVTGPGPFSRIRTAVVTANSLAYVLRIPVAGLQVSAVPDNLFLLDKLTAAKQVLPFYERPPNITKPKKR